MRNDQFAGKVALVTGAGTGMGADTAALLAQRGASVALLGRREAPLRDVAARIEEDGGKALVLPADVASPDAVAEAVATVTQHFGALHYAVNNAGVASENADVTHMPLEVWQNTIEVNLSAHFYGMRAELPAIAASGGGASLPFGISPGMPGFPFG